MTGQASRALGYVGTHFAASRNFAFEIRCDRAIKRIVAPPIGTTQRGSGFGAGRPAARASVAAHSPRGIGSSSTTL
jgi:hypothetical protein